MFNPFKLESFTITDTEGEPYLTRWVLARLFGRKVYLHLIHKSDGDRDLHDHPWRFVSVLLRGSYTEYEHLELEKKIRFLNIRLRAHIPHRLVLERPVLTLVFIGKKTREWGFYTPTGWVHNNDYLDAKFGVGNWTDVSDYD